MIAVLISTARTGYVIQYLKLYLSSQLCAQYQNRQFAYQPRKYIVRKLPKAFVLKTVKPPEKAQTRMSMARYWLPARV